ncbi:MAG: chorismate mutase [Bacillota bacterium]|nr:chorismate mutase [Bacillota bacterium]MDP4169414.1 chorismate mutase [Bacillota bacterium]
MLRGVRGAITVIENKEADILKATEKLLNVMIEKNNLSADSVASVFISTTDDITAVFPARAMRALDGWKYVPVMCMKEMTTPDSINFCIRIMMHINTDKGQTEIHHVYLEGASGLRPDLDSN